MPQGLMGYWSDSVPVHYSAIKLNMSDLELRKGKTKVGKQGVHSLYLFEIAKYKLNSDLKNLISFSVIYRFIGLRHKITDMLQSTENTAQTKQ